MRQSRAEDGVLPIGVGQRTALVFEIGGDDGRNLVIARCPAFIVGIVDRPRRHLRQIGVVARLLVELRELVGVEHIIGFRHARYAELTVVTDYGMFVLTALGRDEDNAARTARTVDRRRRSVLEHFEALDVVAVEVREGTGVARNAVDDVERVVARRGGLDAADADRDVAVGLAAQLEHLHARHLGGHGVTEIGRRKPFEILGLDRRDRRRHVALILHAVAYDHHVVHGDRLAFQRDVGLSLGVRKCDGYLVITDQRYFEHRVFLADRQRIFAVEPRRRTRRGAFQDDGGADHGRAVFIGHAPFHRAGGVGCGLRRLFRLGGEDDLAAFDLDAHIGKDFRKDGFDTPVFGVHRNLPMRRRIDLGIHISERVRARRLDPLQEFLDGDVPGVERDDRRLGPRRNGEAGTQDDGQHSLPHRFQVKIRFIHNYLVCY